MKSENIIVLFLYLVFQCSVAEGSSSEEPFAVSADISSFPVLQEGTKRKKGVTKNKILPLQADPVILNKNVECIVPNKNAKESNASFSCCTGRKVKDRTGVRHRLLHLEYSSERGTQ